MVAARSSFLVPVFSVLALIAAEAKGPKSQDISAKSEGTKSPKGPKSGKSSSFGQQPSGQPSGQPSISPAPTSKFRRLLDVGFESDQLFHHMKGDELHRHLARYESQVTDGLLNTLGVCDNPRSRNFCKSATYDDCFGPSNALSDDQAMRYANKVCDTNGVIVEAMDTSEPWASPITNKARLLAADPGIWTIENFLSENEADTLLNLVEEYGKDNRMFGPCKDIEMQPGDARPTEAKVCFMISPERVCKGPNFHGLDNPCDFSTQAKDGEFITYLLAKVKNLWNIDVEADPFAKVQVSIGDTAPIDLHNDDNVAITFAIGLSNGGAGAIFPYAMDGVSVFPKKGTAHTWLNVDRLGRRNPRADHAVQAHPLSAGERIVVIVDFLLKDITNFTIATL